MRNPILNCHLNETSPNQLNQRKTLAATGSIWKLRQPPPRNPPARQVSSYRACRNKKSYWLCQFPRFIELASGYRRYQERLTTVMPLSKSAKACICAICRNIWLAYFHQVFCPNHPINQYFFNSPRHGTRTGTRTGPWEGQDGQDVIVQYWQDVDARGGQDDQGKEGARLKALESGKLVDTKTSDPKPIIW